MDTGNNITVGNSMKIKALYFKSVIQTKGYVTSLNSLKHSITYIQEMDSYLIDNTTLIPASNVAEVAVEVETIKPSVTTRDELLNLPEDCPEEEAVKHSIKLQQKKSKK